jgi:hypothetical protein
MAVNKNKREVRYLNKDFSQFKESLINYTKTYFPNTYNDFNEASPGMLFLEQAAVVGDVLSFYMDLQLRESLLTQATERANIIARATGLGYKVKNRIPSTAKIDVYQLVPAITAGSDVVPDLRYALKILPGMVVGSTTNRNVQFRTLDYVDMKLSGSNSPLEITVYEINDITNEPTFFLLKKSANVINGTQKTATFNFNESKPFDRITLSDDEGIIEIVSVADADGNTWSEVPYLAQDTIYDSVLNVSKNDPVSSVYADETPYLLKLKKVPRRFVTKFQSNGDLQIQFGGGIAGLDDEELIPNPDTVGSNIYLATNSSDQAIDPTNFLYTRTYGIAPSNTTLTVTYTIGGGLESNVSANDIVELLSVVFEEDDISLNTALLNTVKSSVAVNNPASANGGKSEETDEEIRQNALANYATQLRNVTKEDYISRCYSLPPKYGSIAKAFITRDFQIDKTDPKTKIANPLALNLYLLSYDANNTLVPVNSATKENLKTYLNQYRILTDAVNLKDAFVINIGINFEIVVYADRNANEVLLQAIDSIKTFFNIQKWQINQPILLSEIYNIISLTSGVQSVINAEIENLFDQDLGYSGNVYDIAAATRDQIVFPSLDPSIFEIKYLNRDIKGKVINY